MGRRRRDQNDEPVAGSASVSVREAHLQEMGFRIAFVKGDWGHDADGGATVSATLARRAASARRFTQAATSRDGSSGSPQMKRANRLPRVVT